MIFGKLNPHTLLIGFLKYIKFYAKPVDGYPDAEAIESRLRCSCHLLGTILLQNNNVDQFKHCVNGNVSVWLSDCGMFLAEGANAIGYRDIFFRRTAVPIAQGIAALEDFANPHRRQLALSIAQTMEQSEWQTAMIQFIESQPEINVVNQQTTSTVPPAPAQG